MEKRKEQIREGRDKARFKIEETEDKDPLYWLITMPYYLLTNYN